MSQEPEDRPAPANLEAAFAVKGALDPVTAADYCRWRAGSIRGVQEGLVREGHLTAPHPAALREFALYTRMASFFAHIAPIRDEVRALIVQEIARKRAQTAAEDAEIERRREERYRPGPNLPSGVVAADDGPEEQQEAQPAPPRPRRPRRA